MTCFSLLPVYSICVQSNLIWIKSQEKMTIALWRCVVAACRCLVVVFTILVHDINWAITNILQVSSGLKGLKVKCHRRCDGEPKRWLHFWATWQFLSSAISSIYLFLRFSCFRSTIFSDCCSYFDSSNQCLLYLEELLHNLVHHLRTCTRFSCTGSFSSADWLYINSIKTEKQGNTNDY